MIVVVMKPHENGIVVVRLLQVFQTFAMTMSVCSAILVFMTISEKKLSDNLKSASRHIPEIMHACLFYGPLDIRYEQIPTPKINENEILVKVNTVLTGGTDLKTFKRGHPVLIKSVPSTFGHQFSGTVVKAGKNVKKFSCDQRVVSLNSAPCFECNFCKKKRFSLCENIEFLNGAYAQYIAIPERIVEYNTYEIPENLDFEMAAELESLAVVVHGYERSKITKDKTICVIGTGSIGLLFVALAKLNGVKVVSLGRNPLKLNIAKEIGADFTLNTKNYSEEELIKEINSLTNNHGPEVVIEAVGLPETWELATKIVGKGGLVNFFGGCKKGTKVELDTFRLHYDELKLIGVFHHMPEYVQKALDLLASGSFEKIIRKIITKTVPLRELKNAFLLHESQEVIQIAVKPEEYR